MGRPTDIGIIDTMIGFPTDDPKARYEFIAKQMEEHDTEETARKKRRHGEEPVPTPEGGSKWGTMNRVLSDSELNTLLDGIRDNRFNLFVRFAYYTGARSGEIRSISRENIFSNQYSRIW